MLMSKIYNRKKSLLKSCLGCLSSPLPPFVKKNKKTVIVDLNIKPVSSSANKYVPANNNHICLLAKNSYNSNTND